MLNSKQRAFLRKLANPLPSKYQIGKEGFESDSFLKQIDAALEKNELIKITVLENADLVPRQASDRLCELVLAEPVQTIGSKIVLYRRSNKEPKIELPK